MERLLETLKFSSTLESLKILNVDRRESAAALGVGSGSAEVLKHSTTLSALTLENVFLKPENVIPVAEALRANRALTSLRLARNAIGSEGLRWIVRGLEENRTLRTLELHDNRIEDEGLRCLADALKSNRLSIRHLSVRDYGLSDSALCYFVDCMKQNTTLRRLSLSDRALDKIPSFALEEMLKKNTTLVRVRGAGERSRLCAELIRANAALAGFTLRRARGKFADARVRVRARGAQLEFSVHRALLCARSAYFRLAFESESREVREVDIEEEDPRAFSALLDFWYTDRLDMRVLERQDSFLKCAEKYCAKELVSYFKRCISLERPFANQKIGRDLEVLVNSAKFHDVVFVMDDAARYYAHKFVLVARSEYFRAMFESGMRESRSYEIQLHDVDSRTFHKLLFWMYTGRAKKPTKDLKRVAKMYLCDLS